MRAFRSAPRPKPRGRNGQASAEYALILAALSMALLLPIGGSHKAFMGAILDAYKTYFDSFYYVLNLPFP
jgi:Flp pilus assembly pilin Flp